MLRALTNLGFWQPKSFESSDCLEKFFLQRVGARQLQHMPISEQSQLCRFLGILGDGPSNNHKTPSLGPAVRPVRKLRSLPAMSQFLKTSGLRSASNCAILLGDDNVAAALVFQYSQQVAV